MNFFGSSLLEISSIAVVALVAYLFAWILANFIRRISDRRQSEYDLTHPSQVKSLWKIALGSLLAGWLLVECIAWCLSVSSDYVLDDSLVDHVIVHRMGYSQGHIRSVRSRIAEQLGYCTELGNGSEIANGSSVGKLAVTSAAYEFLSQLMGGKASEFIENNERHDWLKSLFDCSKGGSLELAGEFEVLIQLLNVSMPKTSEETRNTSIVPTPKIGILDGAGTVQFIDYMRSEDEAIQLLAEKFENESNRPVDADYDIKEYILKIEILKAATSIVQDMFDPVYRIANLLLGWVQLLIYITFIAGMCYLILVRSFLMADGYQTNLSKQVLNIIGAKSESLRELRNESNYAVADYIGWAMPTLGFVGTVLGIATSLGSADKIFAPGQEQKAMAISEITGLLMVAFNTTFLALVLGLIFTLKLSLLRAKETRLIELVAAEENRD